MLRPTCWSQQYATSTLDEEHAQIAVSELGDAAKDGAITRRHLLRHQAKPGSKVTSFAKGSAIADRGHHRTRDDRADPRNRDQLLAAFVSVRQGLDLIRYPFDALIEIFPIGHKVPNDPDHSRR